jgi:peptidylprolyl isomerase
MRPGASAIVGAVILPLLGACDGAEQEEQPVVAEPEDPEPRDRPDVLAEADLTGDPPTELQIDDVVIGEGEPVGAGDTVSVHYVGVGWSTRDEFGTSWERGQPLSFTIGAGNVIAGWDQGVEGMQVGGRRTLTIPPDLAYGDRGVDGVIAPGETLVFVVDLVAADRDG